VDILALDLIMLNSKAFRASVPELDFIFAEPQRVRQRSQPAIYVSAINLFGASVLVLGLSPYKIASAMDRLNSSSYVHLTSMLLLWLLSLRSSCHSFPHLALVICAC